MEPDGGGRSTKVRSSHDRFLTAVRIPWASQAKTFDSREVVSRFRRRPAESAGSAHWEHAFGFDHRDREREHEKAAARTEVRATAA